MRYLFACILIIVMGCVAWLLTGTRQAATEAQAQRFISEPLPNKGINTDTLGYLSYDHVDLPNSAFNRQRRVARFIIDTRRWQQEGTFRPKSGDILQVQLKLDKDTILTDPLEKVDEYTYERSVTIPMKVRETEWSVVKNRNNKLTQMRHQEIDADGKIITNGIR